MGFVPPGLDWEMQLGFWVDPPLGDYHWLRKNMPSHLIEAATPTPVQGPKWKPMLRDADGFELPRRAKAKAKSKAAAERKAEPRVAAKPMATPTPIQNRYQALSEEGQEDRGVWPLRGHSAESSCA